MCCGASNSQPQAAKTIRKPSTQGVVIPFNNSKQGYTPNALTIPKAVKDKLIMQQQIARIPKKGVGNG